ncbi:MAG: hypothetical protein R2752_23850, partial [Vicinamibacterales bacterium]
MTRHRAVVGHPDPALRPVRNVDLHPPHLDGRLLEARGAALGVGGRQRERQIDFLHPAVHPAAIEA